MVVPDELLVTGGAVTLAAMEIAHAVGNLVACVSWALATEAARAASKFTLVYIAVSTMPLLKVEAVVDSQRCVESVKEHTTDEVVEVVPVTSQPVVVLPHVVEQDDLAIQATTQSLAVLLIVQEDDEDAEEVADVLVADVLEGPSVDCVFCVC